jgi:hypothetical protein
MHTTVYFKFLPGRFRVSMLFSPVIPLITYAIQTVVEYGTLTRRRSPPEHVVVRLSSFACALALFILMSRLGVRVLYLSYLCTLPLFVPCMLLFTESRAQKVFFCFTSWGVTTFLSSLCNYLAIWIMGKGHVYPARYFLYVGSAVIVLIVFFRFARDGYRTLLLRLSRGNPAYVVFPMIAFALLSLLFTPFDTSLSSAKIVGMVLFEAFTVFTYYVMASNFNALYKRSQYEARLENAERIVSLQKKHYGEVEKSILAQSKLAHDARHHYVVLSTLANTGDCASLREYLDRLLGEGVAGAPRRYCVNAVANAVIGGYVEIAEGKGIAVSTDIDLASDTRMDDYELCALFGNAIENAIEACQRIPAETERYSRRSIVIKALTEKDRLVVRIENSYQPSTGDREGFFPSSKGAREGIGLESIRAIVERHDGALHCERKDGTFALSAILSLLA